VLYIKKEKVLDKRALKGAADNGTTDNNGPVFKEIRPVKLDFSATNFKSKVTGWRLSIENKADTLFPTICDTARGIAGIPAATADQLEHQDPQILARANLASEDEDSSAEHEKENTQAIEEHADIFDEHRDNGGDRHSNGNNSGVDEDRNNGGDDLDGRDKEGDNKITSDDGDNYDNDHNDEIEEEHYAEDSDLTDIGSNSASIVEVVHAPCTRRKGV
jgi:hypothetical protein